MSDEKEDFTRKESIHPRTMLGGTKLNTCGNSSLTKRLERAKRGIMEHVSRHPRDMVSAARISRINAQLKSA